MATGLSFFNQDFQQVMDANDGGSLGKGKSDQNVAYKRSDS